MDQIEEIRSAVIRCPLAVPVVFGDWKITHREFVAVGLRSTSGALGFSYCLTRDGPVKEVIDRTVAPMYLGRGVDEPETSFFRTLWSNHSVHAAGIGMRALSIVDIAAWDLACRTAGESLVARLGGTRLPLPATAIVGYPPTMSAEETAAQVTRLWSDGWRRFKLPIAPTLASTIARLEATREAAPEGWIGVDANMTFRSAAEVIAFAQSTSHLNLGWIEDIVPPGDASMVRAAREGSGTPIAVGDEQGGSYFPEALLQVAAANVVRVDVTTDGGITRLRQILPKILESGATFAPHMYAHTHSRILNGLGLVAPIEWGIPETGVHPMDDPLEQPRVEDGLMLPLAEGPGIGDLLHLEWLGTVQVIDPDRLLEWV